MSHRRGLPTPNNGYYQAPPPLSPRALRPASIANFDLEANDLQLGQSQDPFQDGFTANAANVYNSQQIHAVQGPLANGDYSTVPAYQEEQHEAADIENYLLNLEKPAWYDYDTPVDFSPRNYQREWKSKETVQDNDGASSRSGASIRSVETGQVASAHHETPKLHFGAPPTGPQKRRNANNANKRVALTHGNLVLDCPIPSRLNTFLPRKDAEEFRFMRYSAVTCDPDDFEKCHFTVRPALLDRETELCIAVTMYNEDEILFCRTMHNVMKNISHLCSREKSSTWGKDGWKKVVVVIIADGRKNIHPRVLDCLSAMGVYQPGVAKNIVEQNGKSLPVQAHLYEFTTQLSVSPDLKFKGLEKGIVPTQIVFVLKENNARKLNSHRWFFNAVCPQLKPNICILLDVGTKPGPKSLYHLWKTFNRHSNVAGAAGEICVMKGKLGLGLINPLVACQNFEYKMSNILDKPTESVFGYISVLPGAFSAYRYIALQNDALGHGPLASYFKGEQLAGQDADVFTSNLYLAEDRILCWELVAKAGENWVLKYVSAAQGETDVPDTAEEWISQRRRWLNGSFFAAVYAQTHVLQIFKTDHTIFRKLTLLLESVYQLINLVFAWFALANFYIFFMILTSALEDKSFGLKGMVYVNMVAQYLYAATLIATFVFSMGNRPQPSRWQYMGCMASFTLLTAYMMAAAAFCIYRAATNLSVNPAFAQIVLSLAATYGCYVLSSLLALDPWHLVTSMGQYLLMQAIYINVLQAYAFSNLHDFSWGTKQISQQATDLGVVRSVAGQDSVEISLPTSQADIDVAYDEALHQLKTRPKVLKAERSPQEKEQMKQDYYRNVRTNVILFWLLTNGILAACILHGDIKNVFVPNTTTSVSPTDNTQLSNSHAARVYMIVILACVTTISVVRLVMSTLYLVIRMFGGC